MRDVRDFQAQMVALVRVFGLHHPDRTLCGQPVSVSAAHALMELAEGEPLAQSALAERLHLEKSTVSRLVDQLARSGWIVRERDRVDGRVFLVRLTDAGWRVSEQLAVARTAKFACIFSEIPVAERDAVQHALSLLQRAITTSQLRRTPHATLDWDGGAGTDNRTDRQLPGRAD